MTRIILQSAREFDLLKPRADLITTLDIAHALSLICRFNGHCNRHYSVAQHSLLVADIVQSQGHSPEIQLQALLHDAAEAYVGDMVSPLKRLLWEANGYFDEIEERVWRAICERFDLEPALPDCIHTADMIALATERRELLRSKLVLLQLMMTYSVHHLVNQELRFPGGDPVDALADMWWNEVFASGLARSSD